MALVPALEQSRETKERIAGFEIDMIETPSVPEPDVPLAPALPAHVIRQQPARVAILTPFGPSHQDLGEDVFGIARKAPMI